jgi:formate-dependent nitrite reductase membrane component NrfD
MSKQITTPPPHEEGTYYGRSVVAEPVWNPSIPAYFFAGGLAGASAGLGLLARLRGNHHLARTCTLTSAAVVAVCPPLLIEDLGRPERFLHMLRVFKVTSPMSVGTWILSAFGALSGAAAASELTGVALPAGRAAEAGAGVLGLPLATYTAALLANTSMPVWHEARRLLPLVFAAGSAASAGALATLASPRRHSAMARRLAVGGALAEVALIQAMERSLGDAGRPYREGPAGRLARMAAPLMLGGAAGIVAGRWNRLLGTSGALGVLAGALLERFAVWKAGPESARLTVR